MNIFKKLIWGYRLATEKEKFIAEQEKQFGNELPVWGHYPPTNNERRI